ncbi:phage baseplate protein [Bacteroides sp.]|uniref:phage baseplate protein n=1 Tax=Bacteroides sp. TaxID=29523 RepID=UPI0026227780|nr:hypothetical protein [Bacteroides sp.]MDD3039008.1 hypothetical protein [Bacteroides sp.]
MTTVDPWTQPVEGWTHFDSWRDNQLALIDCGHFVAQHEANLNSCTNCYNFNRQIIKKLPPGSPTNPTTPTTPTTPSGGSTNGAGNALTNNITIGGKNFLAVEMVDLEGNFLVPEHPLEDQYIVHDHIFELPSVFKITISLDREKNEHIAFQELLSAKKLHTVITPFKVIDQMAIGTFKLQMSDSENILYASFSLTEIRKATATFTQGAGIQGDWTPTDTQNPANTGRAQETPSPETPPEQECDIWCTLGNAANVAVNIIPLAATALLNPTAAVLLAGQTIGTAIGNAFFPK